MKTVLVLICLMLAPQLGKSQTVNQTVELAKKIVEAVQDQGETKFKSENGNIGECDMVILLNDLLRKKVNFEQDFETISHNEGRVCFMTEEYLFEQRVKSYIEFKKISIKSSKIKYRFDLITQKTMRKDIIESKKGTFLINK